MSELGLIQAKLEHGAGGEFSAHILPSECRTLLNVLELVDNDEKMARCMEYIEARAKVHDGDAMQLLRDLELLKPNLDQLTMP